MRDAKLLLATRAVVDADADSNARFTPLLALGDVYVALRARLPRPVARKLLFYSHVYANLPEVLLDELHASVDAEIQRVEHEEAETTRIESAAAANRALAHMDTAVTRLSKTRA